MEVEFNLTLKDALAFAQHCQQKTAGRQKLIGNWIWYVILIVLIGWILFSDPKNRSFARALDFLLPGFMGAVLGVIGTGLFFIRWYKISVQGVQQSLNDPRNQSIFERKRLTISADGLTLETRMVREFDHWGAFLEIEAAPTYIYFWIGSNSAHVIPATAFRDHKEIEDFVALARRYYEGQNRARSEAITTGQPAPSTDFIRRDSP
jgi:hypothetical protein